MADHVSLQLNPTSAARPPGMSIAGQIAVGPNSVPFGHVSKPTPRVRIGGSTSCLHYAISLRVLPMFQVRFPTSSAAFGPMGHPIEMLYFLTPSGHGARQVVDFLRRIQQLFQLCAMTHTEAIVDVTATDTGFSRFRTSRVQISEPSVAPCMALGNKPNLPLFFDTRSCSSNSMVTSPHFPVVK